jgi:hypothetical protein
MPGWDYGKNGITVVCNAAALYDGDDVFHEMVDGYLADYGYGGKPTFNIRAGVDFINSLYTLAPNLDDYYNKPQPDLEPIMGVEATMSDYMSQVVAGAMSGNIQFDMAATINGLPESNVFGSLFKTMAFASAHMPQVYYAAVVTGAFGE